VIRPARTSEACRRRSREAEPKRRNCPLRRSSSARLRRSGKISVILWISSTRRAWALEPMEVEEEFGCHSLLAAWSAALARTQDRDYRKVCQTLLDCASMAWGA
jgi:hypothetical protein